MFIVLFSCHIFHYSMIYRMFAPLSVGATPFSEGETLIYNKVLSQTCQLYTVVKISDCPCQWSQIAFVNSDLLIVITSSATMKSKAGSTQALLWLIREVCYGYQDGEGWHPVYLPSLTYTNKHLKSKNICHWPLYWPELIWLSEVCNSHSTHSSGLVYPLKEHY